MQRKIIPKYSCSPPVTSSTKASLTLNDFSKGGDGGGPSECDDKYHEKTERVVALSTGCEHAGQPPCHNNIVDGSDAVWEALGLNKDLGVVDVTWSMA
ncbi:hypothetical protein GH714_002330 [Hevea brasiliensis]|uniref:RlpA-like protein double-psi beta-barrel domain-containing protein n=1 Tax=Hevea brasiliensis TaxID=3981 RepID=A0A6A6K3P2_HEVBR|nr:hypothetical protein GH714_002330 [Hevea brasiliensis]